MLALALIAPAAALALEATPAPAVEVAPPAPPAPPPLPSVELTPRLLFGLMAAEIALQRGEPGSAYLELMHLAKETRDPRLARRATEIAFAGHAQQQALESATLWHDLSPGDSDAEAMHATLLVNLGRYDEARPMVEHQLAQSADPVFLLDRLQRMLARAPDPQRGLTLIESLATRYQNDAQRAFDLHLVLARAQRDAAAPDHGLAQARAALATHPDSEPVVLGVVQSMIDADGAGQVAGRKVALELLGPFVEQHPQSVQARLAYARMLAADGQLGPSRLQFQQVLQALPDQVDALYALGVLELEAERYGAARVWLERYLARQGSGASPAAGAAASPAPDATADARAQDGTQASAEATSEAPPEATPEAVWLAMGRVAEGEHRYDEALAWFGRVQSSGFAPEAREREAFVLGHLNRVDEGMARLAQLPGGAEGNVAGRVLIAQAQLLRDARHYQQSFDLIEGALKDHPNDPGLLYESAMSAERLDRIDVMETRLRRLFELQPGAAQAYNALGFTFADRNIRLEEAYRLIDHALSLSPEDAYIVDSLGWVQFRLGHLDDARKTLERAWQLRENAEVEAHLGEVLWAMGDKDQARTLLLDAQHRDGESDTVRSAVERLRIAP